MVLKFLEVVYSLFGIYWTVEFDVEKELIVGMQFVAVLLFKPSYYQERVLTSVVQHLVHTP